jgi:hypothetical protein
MVEITRVEITGRPTSEERMSNEPIEPNDIVSDGVEEDGKPVPRDGGNADGAATTPSGASHAQAAEGSEVQGSASEGTAPGTGDTNKVPGPAEEQDEETADDRGLTTDTSPD